MNNTTKIFLEIIIKYSVGGKTNCLFNNDLADYSGFTVSTARNHIKKLVAMNLLTLEPQFICDGVSICKPATVNNMYTLNQIEIDKLYVSDVITQRPEQHNHEKCNNYGLGYTYQDDGITLLRDKDGSPIHTPIVPFTM